ncbi:hypothetical protein V8F20_002735 [Naviculisporaceae sp. PSN 640]
MASSLLFLTTVALLPAVSLGFGTSTGTLDNNAEHEKITKASLMCQGDAVSGSCFSEESMGQLAGGLGTFGAVGNPDNPIWGITLEGHEAHCDMADFFPSPDYPQSREQATAVLLDCVDHIHERFRQGIEGAAGMLDEDGYLIPDEVKIPLTGCSMGTAIKSDNSKCTAILGFGRALHGVQDFYSHSNWADEADQNQNISVLNPPGLANTGLAPFLDSRFIGPPYIPYNLTTECWEWDDETPGVGDCLNRISHNTINKDGGEIDPVTGNPTNPNPDKGPRGGINDNFARAVRSAIAETRRQWRNFRDTIIEEHGEVKGARIICALTRDDPMKDCNGRKVGIVVDSSGSNSWNDPGNLRIAAAQAINEALVTQDEATNPNSKPDLVTVVDFDSYASVIYPLGDPSGADFSSIDSDGGTYIAGGIKAALDEILADETYNTRGRSAVIVLTDGEDSEVVDRLFQLARAYVAGIKVSFGFLAPVQVIEGASAMRHGVEKRQVSTAPEVLAAVLKTGGIFTTIDSAEAQAAFVNLVLTNGLSAADDGDAATPLTKGLGIVGLVIDTQIASYYEYDAKSGEELQIDFETQSSCLYNATLTDVYTGTVIGSVAGFTGTESFEYTASANVKLELEVTAVSADGTPGKELECIFRVQLAGEYIPPVPSSVPPSSSVASSTAPPSSASSIVSSSAISSSADASSTPSSSAVSSSVVSSVGSASSSVAASTKPYPVTSGGGGHYYPTVTGTGKPTGGDGYPTKKPVKSYVTSIKTTITSPCSVTLTKTDAQGSTYYQTTTTLSVYPTTTVVTKSYEDHKHVYGHETETGSYAPQLAKPTYPVGDNKSYEHGDKDEYPTKETQVQTDAPGVAKPTGGWSTATTPSYDAPAPDESETQTKVYIAGAAVVGDRPTLAGMILALGGFVLGL